MPLATVLVPMRNAEPYVRATLASLLRDAIDVEIIVIDDHSSDGSPAVVRACADARVSMIGGPGRGISAALNAGLAQARAPLLMRCDADDFYSAGRMPQQIRWLQGNPQFGAVCGGFSAMDARGRFVAELPTGSEPEELTRELQEGKTRTPLCAYAMRTELVRSIGGFREYFVTAEDIDLQLRLARYARVMYLPGDCYRYRLHGESMTHTQARAQRLHYESVARQLQRQRRPDGCDDLDLGQEVPAAPAPTAPDGATMQILGFIEGAAWTAHARGRKLAALRIGLRGLRYQRWKLSLWRMLLALLLKPGRPPAADSNCASSA
jgi:glycosyltransferase involved in cell wall biosynthesis